jgi:hypothetical protein
MTLCQAFSKQAHCDKAATDPRYRHGSGLH